ncbi:MAG: hypothetical protein COZ06_25540 [Armatimonadetes bacterium CG_4_10_14_3_um_filter_66_18]|nr:FHA domain-containing protein [Armatimonadota bacterium]PIU87624.1 MAG: hypothetical protein COS65_33805 [Armatimonadetes bacterium CG06_land_8_20_14_3_00_66_21]PIW13162.1 MAG: hypothetical protein COW34_11075 [Armatimonadetes bacterium CG17_big_fil_post_rev_8_21_14_2_50_66_6]PIX42823.1 MAG: hypothetical protein COZ57_20625 [Armatimonadetes bacterium CG_4_8_14_3_um_filter_66_20]PIY42281.1 MAG: hypothetical protein COZ06_25540 [Armatimonadetes bacterium CG_4_10_14_3_um_filter_66_18]PIZ41355.
MPEPQTSLLDALQLVVVLRYLLPALLFLFVLQVVRTMAADLRRSGRGDTAGGATAGPADLVVIQGASPAAGERFRLRSDSILLGRDSSAEVVLVDQYASSRHAQIDRHEGRFYLTDLDTTNGTLLNGHRLKEPTYLAEGDEIEIGEIVFRFERSGDAA